MKKVKYHITDQGPRECRAEIRSCPIGGSHYNSRDDANSAFLFGLKKDFAEIPKSEKRSLPDVQSMGVVVPMKGGSFFGTVITDRLIGNHIGALKAYLGDNKFEEVENYKINRDGGLHFHLTILDPKDLRTLGKNGVKEQPTFNFTLKGIGSVSNNEGHEAWYICVESDDIQRWRSELGLEKKDLHITLGFIGKDIHNMSKDLSTLKIN